MSDQAPVWGTIHSSVYSQAANMVRWAEATPRPHGAIRYPCPITGGLVLVTDEATLASLQRPRARLRCASCGEMHLLTQNTETTPPSVIVASPAKP